MERQMGVETEGAQSQRNPREELRAQRRGRQRVGGGLGFRGAQTPRPGHRGRKRKKRQQTPRGGAGGERGREAPLGLFPAGFRSRLLPSNT